MFARFWPAVCGTLLLLVFLLGWHAVERKPAANLANEQKVFARVMQTSSIRCGYSLRSPFILKDPNTGALSGISYDYMVALGEALSLKIDWVQEAGNGEMVQDLKMGKYDAFCTALWPTSARAREVNFAHPLGYMPVYVFGRTNEKRFHNYAELNQSAVRFAQIDGYATNRVTKKFFPSASNISLPELSTADQVFQEIIQHKADVTLGDAVFADNYSQKNPGQIMHLALPPLAAFPLSIAIAADDYRLERMLSIATEELLNDGSIQRILEKNGYGAGQIIIK